MEKWNPPKFKRKIFIYRGIKILKIDNRIYRLEIGNGIIQAEYNAGIMEIINEIDYMINLLKGGKI